MSIKWLVVGRRRFPLYIACRNRPYHVSGGTLNRTHSLTH